MSADSDTNIFGTLILKKILKIYHALCVPFVNE